MRNLVRGRPGVFVGLVTAAFLLACQDNVAAPSPSGGPPAAVAGMPASMAALGDSITTGYGSCLTLSNCLRNSWTTGDGTLVNSQYKRILAKNAAIRGHAHNFGSAGAVAADLGAQVSATVAAKPDYVTLLIGANDACRSSVGAMTGTATFKSQVNSALNSLKAGLPNARLLVVSIPDVYHVWSVGHTNKAAVEVWNFGVCPALLANPTSTATADATRRTQFRDRIDAYNQVLETACSSYGARCRSDGGAVHRVQFGLDELSSLDFFHPNTTGQSNLANVTWPGSFTWGG
jgi:lysophospholipase L1-like esterase